MSLFRFSSAFSCWETSWSWWMLPHREIASEIIWELLYINLKLFHLLRKLSPQIINFCFVFTTVNAFYLILYCENFAPWILIPFLKSGKKEAILALRLHWKPLYFTKKSSQDNYLKFFATKKWKLNAITHWYKCNICSKYGESYVKIYFEL